MGGFTRPFSNSSAAQPISVREVLRRFLWQEMSIFDPTTGSRQTPVLGAASPDAFAREREAQPGACEVQPRSRRRRAITSARTPNNPSAPGNPELRLEAVRQPQPESVLLL